MFNKSTNKHPHKHTHIMVIFRFNPVDSPKYQQSPRELCNLYDQYIFPDDQNQTEALKYPRKTISNQ